MAAVFQLVYFACATQAFFVFVLLWTRSKNVAANRILAFAIVVVGVSALYMLYLRSGWYLARPRWLFAIDTLPALYGPLFYLYTRTLLRRDVRARRAWPHFVPFVAFTLDQLPRLLLPGPAKLGLIARGAAPWPRHELWEWAVDLQGLLYFAACLAVVRGHRAALEREFSNLEQKQVRWLGALLVTLLLLWLGSVAAHATGLPILIYVHAALTVLVYVIAYLNAAQPELFLATPAEAQAFLPASAPRLPPAAAPRPPHAPAPEPSPAPPPTSTPPAVEATPPAPAAPADAPSPAPAAPADAPPPASAAPADVPPPLRYQKARLRDDQALAIAGRLRTLFEQQRPYLDPDFALSDLAARLDVSPHHASQVLNEHFGQSFYDYVNSCRVEELKRRLLDPRFNAEKVLAIGLECGFSSKSALNANFKKWAGTTPTDYRRRGGGGAATPLG
jgi:AraC-like DNA-binding protein